MKIKSTTLAVMAISALAAVSSQAATLIWNFTDDNATFDVGTPVDFTISPLSVGNSLGTVADPVNSTSSSSGYTGSTGTGNIGNAYSTGSLSTARGYIEFTVTPSAGFTFSLSDMDFGARSTSTGPQGYALRSSADSYATDIFSVTVANNSVWTLKDNTFTAFESAVAGEAVTFRLFGYNGTGSPGNNTINGRIDDISLTITAVPEPSAAFLGGLGVLCLLRRRR